MPFTVTISLIRTVLLLITFECITPVFVQPVPPDTGQTTLRAKSDAGSLFASLIFEKMEEEEKNEEERDKFLSIELADFTKIAILLSQVHTPQVPQQRIEHRFDLTPPLFKLFCVFLI
jgi:hypothetical protein